MQCVTVLLFLFGSKFVENKLGYFNNIEWKGELFATNVKPRDFARLTIPLTNREVRPSRSLLFLTSIRSSKRSIKSAPIIGSETSPTKNDQMKLSLRPKSSSSLMVPLVDMREPLAA
ncbi:hypothetical protein AVEN_21751-1 [Araneus ventricosus]|uniref:Uncharacterized protein n=1 Tax=Araneus ventricosus TaxID=182803 RepID=A0A4Y2EYD2_ARAVE|nr:hypothetical protein AVEN_21751-1 [Araneus ventricosus]